MQEEQQLEIVEINKFLSKKIIKDGVGNTPANQQEVFFHYILKDENKNLLTGSDLTYFTLTLGQQQSQWYIEETLKTMKIGERCIVTIKNPEYSEQEVTDEEREKYLFENFENNKELELEIEIIRFGLMKTNNWDLTQDQRFERASVLKNEGNAYIKQQKFQEAREVYSEGLKIVRKDNCQELKNGLMNNMALAFLKLKEFENCVITCQEALESQPKNTKVIYRLGMAQMGNGDYPEARATFNKGLVIEPTNAELKKELENCKLKEKQDLKKQQKVYGNMFK